MLAITTSDILLLLATVAGVLAAISSLVSLLYIFYSAADPQLVAMKAYLRGKHRLKCLPPSKIIYATNAAKQRQQFLSKFREIDRPTDFPRFEIRESPPDIENEGSRREFSPADAVGQMARIRWQFSHPELLLLERVVDTAVDVIDRKLGGTGAPVPRGLLGAVRLEPIRNPLQSKDIFPWTVILETNYPEFFRSEFERLGDWLAIGIDFDRPSVFMRYGLCVVTGGQLGEVGGLLNVLDQNFLMTCAHVLSPECQSLIVRGDQTASGQQPDAALIHNGSPCFSNSRSPSHRAPATRQENNYGYRRKDTVRYANLRHKRVRGYLYGPVSAVPIDGVVHRFPHEMVVPAIRLIFGVLPWPPGSGHFSEPSDSGSWMLLEKAGSWLGMLIGGDPFTRISYVADGAALRDFFEMELVRRGHVNSPGTTAPMALE